MKIFLLIGWWLGSLGMILTLQAQRNIQPWVLEVNAGATLLSDGGLQSGLFPLGYAQTGPSVNVMAHKKIGLNFGYTFGLGATFMPYDASSAGEYLLSADPQAQSVNVQSEAFQLYQVSPGVFYELDVSNNWSVHVRASAGVAFLRSPELHIAIHTAPHTNLTYSSGIATRFQYSFATGIYRRLNDRISAGMSIQFAAADPSMRWQEEGQTIIQGLSLRQWLPSLGLRYEMGKKKPSAGGDI